MNLELVDPTCLRHIEGFSARRVVNLRKKILAQGHWIKPIALDDKHNLVLDGQHRMEVALALGLRRVPVVKFSYAAVEVWSLRPAYAFTWREVVEHALEGDIYPYKTVKHRFPGKFPECDVPLEDLK